MWKKKIKKRLHLILREQHKLQISKTTAALENQIIGGTQKELVKMLEYQNIS